jgi:hypothetical protein
MAPPRLDAEIDRLYQLPLDEFTAARNLLAKQGGAEVKSLTKPPVPAWAVNQLYWRRREPYDALIKASEEMRRAHKTVLGGKGGDIRAAGKAHDEAVDAALKATLSLLEESGQPVTDATRQAIQTTLRALPGDERPGRLTRALQPGGFEMLTGFSIAGPGRALTARAPKARPEPEPAPARESKKTRAAQPAVSAKELAQAREADTAATRDLRQAEHAAKREEFEAARATREAEKAERVLKDARAAFEEAREALQEAEAGVPPATRARDAATRRAEEAEHALESAREKLEAAQDELRRLGS